MRERYLKKSARPGRSNRSGKHVSNLPRHADFKVALHLLDRRGAPSSKEGLGRSRYQSDPAVRQQPLRKEGFA